MSSARSSASGRRCRRRCARPPGATLPIDQATRANLELTRTLARRAARLAARRHRPHRDGGRLAAAGAAAGRAADRSRRRSTGGSTRSRRFVADAARAPGDPRAAQRRARPRPRAVAARGRPRRPARPRRHPRRPRGGRGARARGSTRWRESPAEIAEAATALRAARSGARRASLRRRSPTSCRCSSATAASCAHGYRAALDEARALRDESRRVIAALQARYADETGVHALKIRHNNVLGYFVEVTAQHGDKLMAPPLNAHLHPPPDAGRPGALHHHRARRARSQDRQRRRPRARPRA